MEGRAGADALAPHGAPTRAVGIEAESERISKLLSELEGKDVNEVRARGGAGAGGVHAGAGAGGGGGAQAHAACTDAAPTPRARRS